MDSFPANEMQSTYGVWPDNLLAFDSQRLLFRGTFLARGARVGFDVQLERFLDQRLGV